VIRTLAAPIISVRAYYRGIDYRSTGVEKWKHDLLETLWSATIASGYSTRAPLQLLDFAIPEPADEIAARLAGNEPYTERTVAIEELKPNGAAIEFNNQNWLKDGFTARFVEVGERVE
jgi:hypothetical protein